MLNGKRKSAVAVVGDGIDETALKKLVLEGFEPIIFPKYSRLPAPMANHIDMLVLRLFDKVISFADYCDVASYAFTDLYERLPQGTNIHFVDELPQGEYPQDAILNMLQIGDRLYTKSDTASKGALKIAEQLGLKIRHTRQGYPACTVLKLNTGAVITADRGLARLLEEDGLRVTLIVDGGIELPPYPYGFIGGCSGVFDGIVYFNGDINLHPSAKEICEAIEREGMEIVCLKEGVLRDIGGILFMESKF